MSRMRNAAALLAVVLAPGCMVHSADTKPEAPIKLPDQYTSVDKERVASPDQAGPGRWWEAFGDPELTALIDRALSDSLQLRQTWARLDQAEALARQAGASLQPNVNAELSASRSKRVQSFPGPGGATQTVDITSNSFSASVPVSYEIDLWGKLRSRARAAAYDAFASRDDVEAAAMTLAASVADNWFNIVEQRAVKKLLRDQLLTNEAFLELVMLRFGQGQASATEVLQQRDQVQGVRAQLTLVEARESVIQQQLSVLVGRGPGSLVTSDREELPDLPPLPGPGVPSELLKRRPDVRGAQRRVVAADYRVGEAIANRYPSLTLSGSAGFSSPNLSDLLDSFVWSVMGSISASLWDGGRRSAEVDRTRAVVEERLNGYGQTLLTAMLEVESSLINERQQRANIQELERQVATSRQALEIARERYQQGLSDFLPVLTTLSSLHRAQQSLLTSQRQLLSHRIQLCRALGGTWTTELQKPTKEDDKS